MVPLVTSSSRLLRPRIATDRPAGGQWSGASVPAVLRPSCWWALLIGAPPTPSI